MGRITVVTVLALLALQCSAEFKPVQSIWKYDGFVQTANVASDGPNPLLAMWGIQSRVVAQDFGDHAVLKFEDVHTSLFNGHAKDITDTDENAFIGIDEDAAAILKPFVVYYGDISNITLHHEDDDPVWSVNLKRGFVSTFMIDNPESEDNIYQQHTLYGSCSIKYNVRNEDKNYFVEKTIDHLSCDDSPAYDTGTRSWDPTIGEYAPVKMETKYFYEYNGNPDIKNLQNIHTYSVLKYKSMPGVRSVQKVIQIKNITYVSETETFDKFDTSNINVQSNITFDFTEGVTGGREDHAEKPTGVQLIEDFNQNYDEFKDYFNTVPLKNYDVNTNITIDAMFSALHDMDKDTLQKLSTDIFAKKDNYLYQHMFLSYLPYLGTEDSVKYIKALIENEDENLNDLLAIKILSTFPVYLDDHSEELLTEMEPLTNLKVSNNQVKYAGILSFASLVSDVYHNNKVDKKTYQKYVNQYYKNFKEADEYEVKMTYLLGLINFNGDFTDDMIEICADTSLSYHLRTLAIFGFKKNLKRVPEVYQHFWAIVKNQSEHYEVRVAALDLLLYSNLKYEQFENIINWYHNEFENPDEQHLAHYLYTTIQSLENSTGYYEYLGDYATEAIETMKPIKKSHRVWTTGNYRTAFTDKDSNFGGSLQARLIANPNTNIINLGIFSLDSFALSLNLGSYTAYIKTQGIPDLGFIFAYLASRDNEEPVQHLLNLIKKHGYKFKEFEDPHMEVVLFCDNRVVFGMHIDKDNVDNYSSNPLFLDLLVLAVDYNSLSYPLQDYSYLVSDLGTGIQISNEIIEVSSYELENLDKIFNSITSDSDEETIDAIEYNLKYRSISVYALSTECYNPLVGANVETYKFAKDETYVNIPYSFNMTDFVFKWKHTKDSFNWIQDHGIGSYVDPDHLSRYCDKCESDILISAGPMKEAGTDIDEFESVLGVHINITTGKRTEEQQLLDAIEPERRPGYAEILKTHKRNSFEIPFSKPVLLAWHAGLYNTFIAHDIYSISIRTEPYYKEPTETVFDLEIDSNDIKNDRDPISGEEFDFSVAFTNRKSHNAEVLNYFNATVTYKTKSESYDGETQPHIEHSYDIKMYYDDEKSKKYKICIDREVLYPNRKVDKFSLEPVDPTVATTKVQHGRVEKISDDCPVTNTLLFTEIYTVTDTQKQHLESLEQHDKCKKQSKGFKYVPPTFDCLAAHKVISKYDACSVFVDLSKMDDVPDHIAELSKHEFGIKVLDYKRLNETHITLSFSVEFMNKFARQPVYADYVKKNHVAANKPGGVMSLSPTTVAYNDQDLKIGVSSACYITPDEIRTFHGKVIHNYNTEFGPDAVAFVECFNTTQAGLTIQRLADNAVGFNLWSENNTFVASVHDGKAKVVYNGEVRTETDIKDDDFKIYFLADNVIYISNGLLDIHYTTEYISVKSPSIYNNYICGLCSGDKQ